MDIEGTIQYIINQQAEFVANMHSLEQAQRLQGERIDRLYEIVQQHKDAHIVAYRMIEKLAARLEDFVERQGWLFEGIGCSRKASNASRRRKPGPTRKWTSWQTSSTASSTRSEST